MNGETIEVWSTKYALTGGIQLWTVEDVGSGMVRILGQQYTSYLHKEGRDWHRSLNAAKKRAEDMRLKKIASLRKSITEIEALKFGE